jgi:hypothetical protein
MINKKGELRLVMLLKIDQMMKSNREDLGGHIRVEKIFLIRIKKRWADQAKEVNLNKIKVPKMKWKEEREIFKKKYWSLLKKEIGKSLKWLLLIN